MGCGGCSGSKNGKPNSVPKPRPPKPAKWRQCSDLTTLFAVCEQKTREGRGRG